MKYMHLLFMLIFLLGPFSLMLQVIELQLPSFFNNFDPSKAAASFPSGNTCFDLCDRMVIKLKFYQMDV